MGVPKFYRWISERYPCLSEVVKEFQIPEFDNLYLDMNGVVHTCSHPDDGNPHFRITEEKIFADIFYYLEFLFRTIKPKKVFFMAIDGVAPRAKMNQQRGRRFRSARDAEELERKARESGETLPTEKRFDSNCITPGTEFMVRLQEQLKYFVVKKISTDPLWQGVQVHLSGHETPGEGEHKIMDYIRHEKSKPDYDHNTRHCLYGLDADLMMLGLSSHEPHFSLLREEVKFGGKKDAKKPSTPEETTFHLLHLSLFREYLDFEFSALKDKLPFVYDLERIIDDWILMGFLVGNDFIPHLPNLHINHDALPLIWSTYINVLPHCGGYLHTDGKLHLDRFEIFMTELAKFDYEKFEETFADLKWLESKVDKNPAKKKNHIKEISKLKQRKQDDNQFAALMEESGVNMDEDFDENLMDGDGLEFRHLADIKPPDSHGSTFDEEFRVHKRHYYMTKLEYEEFTDDVLEEQAQCYVRGIQWILYYYFDGVPSWSWFYPHHYAPYISDVKCFKDMDIHFDCSKPFLPFQQLMAVLPSHSKELLPEAYWNLMLMDNSEIIDFYPVNFQTDLNGKQQDWEAVVLIPFIDEKRLLTAMSKVEHLMTNSEKKRNCHSPSLCYDFVLNPLPAYPSSLPGVFPDVVKNHAKLTLIPKDEFQLPRHLIKKGLLKGTRQDVYFPGFPTFKHLPHKAYLKKEGVKVFAANSRGENMILSLLPPKEEDIKTIAISVLHTSLFVNWPHMVEVKVISVSDGNTRYELSTRKSEGGQTKTSVAEEEMNHSDQVIWRKDVVAIRDRYHDRLGVDVGQTHVSLRALPLVGRKYVCGAHGKIVLEKQFSSNPVTFLYQTSVKDLNVYDTSFCQFSTLGELFPAKEAVFMLGWPHYGCQGEVVDVEDDSRVRINVSILEEPSLASVERSQGYLGIQYYPAYAVAPRLSITSHFLSRMTGCIMVTPGSPDNPNERSKTNIGLNLKFTKRNEEVPGYTKKTEEGWTYSGKALDVVQEYLAEFPEIWSYISSKHAGRGDNFYETELFKEGSPHSLKKMTDYLKGLPCSNVKVMKAGAEILDQGVISAVEQEVQKVMEVNKRKQRRVKMQVKPHLLFKPMVGQGNMVADPSVEFYLFDRVVNIRKGYPVPFGLRGTVTGIHIEEKEMDTIYDIVFDEEFQGGITLRCSPGKGYRMPKSGLVNLTHGIRKNEKKTGKAAANQQALNKYHNSSANQQAYNNKQQQSDTWSRSNNMSYAAASQGGRSDNRYSNQGNYNDNRSFTKGEKQYQNSRAEQDSNWRVRNDSNQDYRESSPRQGNYKREGSKDNSQQSQDSNWRVRNDSKRDYRESSPRQGNYKREGSKDNSLQSQVESSCQQSPWKSFNTQGGASSPKFVTPKVTQSGKPTPGKRDVVKGQTGKAFVEPQNSDFLNMWQELKSSGNLEQPGTSLSVAAAALNKLPKPSALSADSGKPPLTGQKEETKLTVESLFNQANKVQHSVDNDQFSNMIKSLEISSTDSTVEMEDGSIVVRSKSPVRDADAEIKQILKIGLATSSLEPGPVKQQEVSTSVPTSAKTYGRQMSVQELFEGVMQPAKHISSTADAKIPETIPGDTSKRNDTQPQGSTGSGHSTSSKSNPSIGAYTNPNSSLPPGLVHPYPPPLQIPPPAMLPQMANHPRQQSQQHQSRGAHPSQQTTPQFRGHQHANQHQKPAQRNPVLELVGLCKVLGLHEPKYDFLGQPGSFTCVVTFVNGQKFMGSRTRTKEEAAESAAGVVLVNMMHPQAMHPLMAPRAFSGMPAQMMQHSQFSSPNSAFKPVSPKEFIEQPRGRYSQPSNYSGNQSQKGRQNQTGNQYSDNRYHQKQQQQQTPSHYHDSRGHYQSANQYPDNRNNNQVINQSSYQGAQRQQQKISPNPRTDNKGTDSKDFSPPKSNPFVPMQVTRKTPSKRRESESRDNNGLLADTSPKPSTSPRSDKDSSWSNQQNTARDLFGDKSQKHVSSTQDSRTDKSELNGEVPRETTPAKSPRQSNPPSKSMGQQQQKRRPRMAANFSMAK